MSYKRISPQPIAEGGTNATSMTDTDGVVYFDGTSLVTTTVGSSTQVLTSNGMGMAPTFQNIPPSTAGPAFSAYQASGDSVGVTGSGTIFTVGSDGTWTGGTLFDTAGAFTDTTCTYIIPQSGVYLMNAQIEVFNTDNTMTVSNFFINCSVFGNIRSRTVQVTGAAGRYTYSVAMLANLIATETLNISVQLSGAVSDTASVAGFSADFNTYFSAFFVMPLLS